MSRRMAVVPGASRVVDADGVPQSDRRGRPLWSMPKPYRVARHQRNAAARAKGADSGTVLVPVYRGLRADVAHDMRSAHRRAERQRENKDKERA